MSDAYRTVTATFHRLTRDAFYVYRPRSADCVLIPRSLVHAADDAKVDGLFIGEEFTFRLREWKAEEIGLP